jgi:hypothetical protein
MLSGQENLIEKQLLKEKPMSCALFWFNLLSHEEKSRRGSKINALNRAIVAFKQITFPVPLGRTNMRICYHS